MLREIHRTVDWIPVGDRWCRMSIMGTDLSEKALARENRGDQDHRTVILMIPGNPGNEGFYTDFGDRLLRNLLSREERMSQRNNQQRTYLFYTISHLNHVLLPEELRQTESKMKVSDRYLLNAQVQHKLDFIREYLPRAERVYLMGHSIGSYMMLKVLPFIRDDFNVKKAIGLFPTVEKMALSPNGVRLRRVLAALDSNDWLARALTFWLDVLPVSLKRTLVGVNLRGAGIAPTVTDAAAELLHMHVFRNIVHMSNDELELVTEFDSNLIKDNGETIYMLYGTDDGWCPLEYGMEMVDRLPKEHVIIDDQNCEHAFVIRDSAKVAEKVLSLIV